jgi:hypothetical protein
VGINELDASNQFLTIYPNPSKGDVFVSSEVAIDLTLINELGQVVQKIRLSEINDYQQEIKGLANGVYFISGTSANQQKIYQKIIILK